jgi:hypothetical protein
LRLSDFRATASPTSGCLSIKVYLLLQRGDRHDDVNPVQAVLVVQVQLRLQVAHPLAAVGEKDHLLVCLHALRFLQLP